MKPYNQIRSQDLAPNSIIFYAVGQKENEMKDVSTERNDDLAKQVEVMKSIIMTL